jgi:adenylyltransferase/sulfurtransferase
LLYLAASGVGKIVIVDFDKVEKSNLHRQVIHCEANVGMNKAVSAYHAIKKLNPSIECIPIQQMFTYDNALDILSDHGCDCIVDACDNPQTRYICNDASILSNKPLISGSAMGTEGQLAVYGLKNSACYRCLYPKVNPSEGCKSCSDNGVLGTVPGLIGILQATETLKVLTDVGTTMHDRLLMYDSMRCTFMNIKKPPPRKNCIICGPNANLTMQDCKELSRNARGPQQNGKIFPKLIFTNSKLSPELNITCKEYENIREKGIPHLLLDVRVQRQYEMCSLSGAVNVELAKIEDHLTTVKTMCKKGTPIYCICRRGIASTEATRLLSEKISFTKVYNIVGGYNAWVEEVDPSFPKY